MHVDLASRKVYARAYYQAHKTILLEKRRQKALTLTSEQKAQRTEYFRTFAKRWKKRNRFMASLARSRAVAKRLGYVACNATAHEIKTAFTGMCHICGSLEGRRKLHLDHCHLTGRFRGWLCNRCNLALGAVQDSVQRLEQMINYLRMKELQ